MAKKKKTSKQSKKPREKPRKDHLSRRDAKQASASQKNSKKSRKNKNSDYTEEYLAEEGVFSWEGDGTMQQGLLVICLFAIAAISFLSFVEAAGEVGVWVDRVLGWLFGWGRYVTPIVFVVLGYLFLHPEKYQIRILNYFGLALFTFSGLALLHLSVPVRELVESAGAGRGGGYVGIVFAYPLLQFTGIWVTIVVLMALFVGAWLLMFNMSLKTFYQRVVLVLSGGVFQSIKKRAKRRIHAAFNGYRMSSVRDQDDDDGEEWEDEEYTEDDFEESPVPFATKEVPAHTMPVIDPNHDPEQLTFIPKQIKKRRARVDLPLSLLHDNHDKANSGDIEANKLKIQKTLESFGIDVEMGEVSVGPMVSQYTLRPSEGVKLTQITTLTDDIALALAAHPIRIEAPIPGKPLVGIEVPNKLTATVTLKELLGAKVFKKRKDNLQMCLGQDVSGKPYYTSIQALPHLLIAGATGSGKSVCMNGLIVSLLYQNSPDDLKMIMVDPKRVELTLYNGIPHLLTPVITDVEKTVNSLKWTVAEMDRRYELLSRAGKRSIEAFNEDADIDDRMPYIVFMIDELADLMSVAAQSVEAAIVRLAQMSRAVGIHLILATQRPSVNVITGLIKANMPARCAFSVTSLVDSRTILDFSGAEKLLGKGDMLYIDAQLSKPKRIQGAFLDSKEIENVVEYLRAQNEENEYDEEITQPTNKSAIPGFSGSGGEDQDELLGEAKEVIVSAGKASASLLQRRLRVGYARAARILDILEEEGFIGPADGSKPREILVHGDEGDEGEPVPDELDDRQHIVDGNEDENRTYL